jgi:rhamnogalacturonyl hydrolase YesR
MTYPMKKRFPPLFCFALLLLCSVNSAAQDALDISVNSNVVVNWTGVAGQAYSVCWTSALTGDFQMLKTRIPTNETVYTDMFHNAQTKGFYMFKRQPESAFSSDPETVAGRVGGRVMYYNQKWGNYTLNLIFESMLEMGRVTGGNTWSNYVFQKMAERGGSWDPGAVIGYDSPPFCHLDYKLYQISGDTNYLSNFITQSALYRDEISRSAEGAILHKDGDTYALLLDRLQDYASRMAQTGMLTGDTNYYAECALQFRLYRQILRDPATGLYSQGRGWLADTNALSPGAWSRGHGWLIRGMVDSLLALPPASDEFTEVQGYLQELAAALLAVQGPDGMWHQLIHLPPGESYPDSTGTGLIIYNLAVALHDGFLSGESYRSAADRAYDALLNYVTPEGLILQACPGPGPLREMESYIRTPGRTEDGESHGPFCVIFACAGKTLLDAP